MIARWALVLGVLLVTAAISFGAPSLYAGETSCGNGFAARSETDILDDETSGDGTFYDCRVLQSPRHQTTLGLLVPGIVGTVGGALGIAATWTGRKTIAPIARPSVPAGGDA